MREASKTSCLGGPVWYWVVVGLICLASSPSAALAEDVAWTLYAGRWAYQKPGATSELGFEVQRPYKDTDFDLVAGLAGTADEAIWAYVGSSWSWEPSDEWRVRPGFAVSFYDPGNGRDLGGLIEFRSSLEATYLVRPNLRLGLMVYHLSNGRLYDVNPGSNSVVAVVGFR